MEDLLVGVKSAKRLEALGRRLGASKKERPHRGRI
jgi:hypothetical protein